MHRSIAGEKAGDVDTWLGHLHDNASRLKTGSISSLQWQEAMDVIYRDTPLTSLKRHLNFRQLSDKIIAEIPESRGERFHRVDLLESRKRKLDGPEPRRALITKVAHIKKGRSVPPHGHSNMASAFLCISGEFAVRQYDKIEDQAEHLIVRQTVDDSSAGIGTWSSISDYRNNIHWLTAKTDDCFLFTSKLIGLETGRPLNGRINIDVRRAEELGSNTLRASKITSREAADLY